LTIVKYIRMKRLLEQEKFTYILVLH